MADGHLGKCKDCAKIDVAENYRKRRVQYAAYERKRYQEAQRHQDKLANDRLYRARNPLKYRAHYTLRNAVRDGRLPVKPCEVCGADAQAHHEDYTKPLEVRWLCREHHLAEHGKIAYSTLEPF